MRLQMLICGNLKTRGFPASRVGLQRPDDRQPGTAAEDSLACTGFIGLGRRGSFFSRPLLDFGRQFAAAWIAGTNRRLARCEWLRQSARVLGRCRFPIRESLHLTDRIRAGIAWGPSEVAQPARVLRLVVATRWTFGPADNNSETDAYSGAGVNATVVLESAARAVVRGLCGQHFGGHM